MSTQTETHAFQAETRQLLDLMIHSLYSHKEIFLRELISNASDALDRRRIAELTDESLRGAATSEPRIRLERDEQARTLVVDDNGVGMSRDEVAENLGTIARSGTRRFLEEMAKRDEVDASDAPALIGQFGVGFYSSFMVADRVVVETRKLGEATGTRWASRGDGEFTIEEVEKGEPGTRVVLHLREKDEEADDESFLDFTKEWTLRSIVKQYSDFVEYPIQLDVERSEPVDPDDPDSEKTTVTRTETLNSMRPLWTRPASEVAESEHTEFFRHLAHDWQGDPLEIVHFRAEGTHEYTALLYLPTTRTPDVLDPTLRKSHVSLYVKRVFVMDDCEELLPPWLRFVRGVVDSADLPLNVSRETLQHSRQIHRMRKRLVKKLLDAMDKVLKERRDAYVAFWRQFGPILKEGLYLDDEFHADLLKVCLWETTAGEAPCTLEEYRDRMPAKQKAVYHVTAPTREAATSSPHLEAAREAGFEVLLMVDPIDEWVVQRVTEYQGAPLQALDRGDVDLGEEETQTEKEAREERAEQLSDVLGKVQTVLDEHVREVRLSSRLRESPAMLVSDPHALSPHMEQMLRATGQDVPRSKRILELNAGHPVVARLEALAAGEATEGGPGFDEFAELLYGQALLAEGSPLPDPARYAKLMGRIMGG